jgi:hypothetical protein
MVLSMRWWPQRLRGNSDCMLVIVIVIVCRHVCSAVLYVCMCVKECSTAVAVLEKVIWHLEMCEEGSSEEEDEKRGV